MCQIVTWCCFNSQSVGLASGCSPHQPNESRTQLTGLKSLSDEYWIKRKHAHTPLDAGTSSTHGHSLDSYQFASRWPVALFSTAFSCFSLVCSFTKRAGLNELVANCVASLYEICHKNKVWFDLYTAITVHENLQNLRIPFRLHPLLFLEKYNMENIVYSHTLYICQCQLLEEFSQWW